MSILNMVFITIYKPDNLLLLLLDMKTIELPLAAGVGGVRDGGEGWGSAIEEIAVQVKEMEK